MKTVMIFLFMILSLNLISQTQIGELIGSDSADEWFGYSTALSANGNIVAIGAPNGDGEDATTGKVYVFENFEGSWIPKGQVIAENTARGLGWSLSLSADGTRLAVGAPLTEIDGISRGGFSVYQFNKTDWEPLGSFITGTVDNAQLGYDISLSADGVFLTVSAPFDDTNVDAGGRVDTYAFLDGDWLEMGASIYGDNQGERFGYTLDVSANFNTLAVGAPGSGGGTSMPGLVRVFQRSGNAWNQIGNDITKHGVEALFGSDVALSSDGHFLSVSSPTSTLLPQHVHNSVVVYQRLHNTWLQFGEELITSSNYSDVPDHCPVAINEDGTTVFAASSSQSVTPKSSGICHVFELQNNNSFESVNTFSSQTSNDGFGHSIDLSSDGGVIAIGIPAHLSTSELIGRVSIFDMSSTATSTAEQEAVSDTYIAPNPGYASFGIYTQIKKASQVLLWNSQGKLIRQYTYQKGSFYNTDGLPSGLYVISLLDENRRTIGSFRWAKK